MTWTVQPEPADEEERAALLYALEHALAAEHAAAPSSYASPWWRAGVAELGGGAAPEEPRGDAGVVEP